MSANRFFGYYLLIAASLLVHAACHKPTDQEPNNSIEKKRAEEGRKRIERRENRKQARGRKKVLDEGSVAYSDNQEYVLDEEEEYTDTLKLLAACSQGACGKEVCSEDDDIYCIDVLYLHNKLVKQQPSQARNILLALSDVPTTEELKKAIFELLASLGEDNPKKLKHIRNMWAWHDGNLFQRFRYAWNDVHSVPQVYFEVKSTLKKVSKKKSELYTEYIHKGYKRKALEMLLKDAERNHNAESIKKYKNILDDRKTLKGYLSQTLEDYEWQYVEENAATGKTWKKHRERFNELFDEHKEIDLNFWLSFYSMMPTKKEEEREYEGYSLQLKKLMDKLEQLENAFKKLQNQEKANRGERKSSFFGWFSN